MVKDALTYIINPLHASVNLATIITMLYKNTDNTLKILIKHKQIGKLFIYYQNSCKAL
jgi:hypothetical protein